MASQAVSHWFEEGGDAGLACLVMLVFGVKHAA